MYIYLEIYYYRIHYLYHDNYITIIFLTKLLHSSTSCRDACSNQSSYIGMHCIYLIILNLNCLVPRSHLHAQPLQTIANWPVVIHMYTSQKYTINVMWFDRTVWLTIFIYDQTYGVFVRILSDD